MGSRLLITNGTIIDGTGRDPIRAGTVTIENGRIVSVDGTAKASEREAQVIEATGTAATILGTEDELGTLEPGLATDVLIVDGDPLTDVKASRSVSSVITKGRLAVQDGQLAA